MTMFPASLNQLIPKPQKEISCQRLLKSQVSRYGFLRKQPDSKGAQLLEEIFRRKWPTKYVILSCGCLYIYGSESSEKYERASSLFGYDSIELDYDTNGPLWAFKVTNNLEDQPKVFRFAASSEDDQTAWIECFTKEILTSNAPLSLNGAPQLNTSVLRNAESVTSKLSDQNKKKIRESVDINDLDYVIMGGEDSLECDDIYNSIDEPETVPDFGPSKQLSKLGWSLPKVPQTNNIVNVKRNEHFEPLKVAAEESDQTLYDDVLAPSTSDVPDSPRQQQQQLSPGNLSSRTRKPLPPPPQCSDVYEDDLPPPASPAPPAPSMPSVSESSKRFSLVSLANQLKPELSTGVVLDKSRLRPPTPEKPPTSVSTSPGIKNYPPPLPPPKKPSFVSSSSSSSPSLDKFPVGPMTRNKSPSFPDLRPQSLVQKGPPPPVASKPQQFPGTPVEKRGDCVSPRPAVPRLRPTEAAPVNKHMSVGLINGSRNRSDCLIYEEPDYENRALILISPKVCPISEEECLADPFVRDAFCKAPSDRSVEILSSCDMDGVFLIRNSVGQESSFKTLLVRTHVPSKRIVKYFIIKSQDGSYRMQWNDAKLFMSLAGILKHYQEHSLPYGSTTLSKPYKQVWNQ